MLAGLIFLGMLTAVSLPDLMNLGGSSTDSVDDSSADPDEPSGDGDMIEPDPAPEGPPADTAPQEEEAQDAEALDEGEDLFLDPEPGITVIESFNPDVDSLTIAVPDEAQEFSVRDASDDAPAVLSFDVPEGRVEIQFTGLSTVPVEDIFLRVSDGSSPTMDADIALVQLIQDDDPVLDPVDPTLPDDPAEPVDLDDEDVVLTPTDPTLPDPPAPPTTETPVVLEPYDDDELLADTMTLVDLIVRDGGEGTAVRTTGSDFDIRSGEDDVVVLEGGEDPGTFDLTEAAPTLGGDVIVVDLGGGDDVLIAGDGPTYGFGGEGQDRLTAGSGAAALYGGAGDDVLTGAGANGNAETFLHGGTGNDTLVGGAAGEFLEGGEHATGPDGTGDDVIDGNGGDDTIRGGRGADSLSGGAGNDFIDHRGVDAERIVAEHHEFAWHVDADIDTLSGGDGNDTLVFDRGDVVTGGAGEDVFWLYSDAAVGDDVSADVRDFVPGEDFLRISLNPQINADGMVQVIQSEDGLDGLVQVDGVTVAVLRGAPDATMADIFVETRPDVFPAG